jgi:hypothetical protein
VELKRSGDSVEVLVGGRAFSTYYFSAMAKPYLFPLRSAEGTVVTRSFPMVTNIPGEDRDEPHQRAMYFAHGDINGFDFWGEAGFSKWSRHSLSTFGRTVFRKLDEMQNGPDSSTLRAEFDLITQEGKAIAEETQGYIFRGMNVRGPSTANLRSMRAMGPSGWATPRRACLPSASSRL